MVRVVIYRGSFCATDVKEVTEELVDFGRCNQEKCIDIIQSNIRRILIFSNEGVRKYSGDYTSSYVTWS